MDYVRRGDEISCAVREIKNIFDADERLFGFMHSVDAAEVNIDISCKDLCGLKEFLTDAGIENIEIVQRPYTEDVARIVLPNCPETLGDLETAREKAVDNIAAIIVQRAFEEAEKEIAKLVGSRQAPLVLKKAVTKKAELLGCSR